MANVNVDWLAASGKLFLTVTRDDGTDEQVAPELAADGSWTYLVPEGVSWVAGYNYVRPGDTVSGKFEISDW